MALPVNIDDLVNHWKVKWARIEYKEGRNPEKVLHTLYAFTSKRKAKTPCQVPAAEGNINVEGMSHEEFLATSKYGFLLLGKHLSKVRLVNFWLRQKWHLGWHPHIFKQDMRNEFE